MNKKLIVVAVVFFFLAIAVGLVYRGSLTKSSLQFPNAPAPTKFDYTLPTEAPADTGLYKNYVPRYGATIGPTKKATPSATRK